MFGNGVAGAPTSARRRNARPRSPFADPNVPESTKATWRARGRATLRPRRLCFRSRLILTLGPQKIAAFVQQTAGRVLRGELGTHAAGVLLTAARTALSAYELNLSARLADLEALAAERGAHPLARVIEHAALPPANAEQETPARG